MNNQAQSDSSARRCKLYRRIFVITSVLTLMGLLSWPLELAIYSGQDGDGMHRWLWNEDPAASTETAALWSYYSLRPILYAAALMALLSFVLYKQAKRKTG